jgi:hypothetical protein
VTGETDLPALLRHLTPTLQDGVFVFATLEPGAPLPAGLDPVMLFREAEGLTLVLDEAAAGRAGLGGGFRCRMLTLGVHSSLAAVGLIAAVAGRLAAAGIAVNPVSGFHHDHLFVPVERAAEALDLLQGLSAQPEVGSR